MGDTWTWTAIDADTKLCVSYLVGGRDALSGDEFMHDCASRIRGRVQIEADGHRVYLDAVEDAFGAELIALSFRRFSVLPAKKNSGAIHRPAALVATYKVVSGNPDPKHVSTSFLEQQNLAMGMSMRRFTRLTNAFSKKSDNHCHSVALYFMYCNFCRGR